MIDWNYNNLVVLNSIAGNVLKVTKDKEIIDTINKHFLKYISEALLHPDNLPEASKYSFNYTYRTIIKYLELTIKNNNKYLEITKFSKPNLERLKTINNKPSYTQLKINL